jgi:hypothetical protein
MLKTRPASIAKHGDSLKMLKLELDFRDAWKPKHFEECREKAHSLEDLGVTMEVEQVSEHPNAQSYRPTLVHRTVSSKTFLRHVTLRIHPRYDSREFAPSLQPHEACGINGGFARHTVISLFDYSGADAMIATVNVLSWALAPGEDLRKYKVQRGWMPEEQRYGLVIDRSIEGQELDRRMRSEPFDSFE